MIPEAGIIYLRDSLKKLDPTHFAYQKLTNAELKALAEKEKTPPPPEELAQEFEEQLKVLIKGILDAESFSQTSEIKHCEYCDYNQVCQRQPKSFFTL